MNPRNSPGRLIAALVLGAFAWGLVLSVTPQWHQRIHADANRVEHSCAVTFIAAGNYEHDSEPPVAIEPPLPVAFERVPFPNPLWVPSPFLSASILEHAPPAHS